MMTKTLAYTHRPRMSLVGGLAQWLGRRSLAGGLSLICA